MKEEISLEGATIFDPNDMDKIVFTNTQLSCLAGILNEKIMLVSVCNYDGIENWINENPEESKKYLKVFPEGLIMLDFIENNNYIHIEGYGLCKLE